MAGDPYWYDNVKLLLPMAGANNSTTFTDLERVPKVATPYGNAKIVTNVADPFGAPLGVASFDGTGDFVRLAYSSDWVIDGIDYTVEGLMYPETVASLRAIVGVYSYISSQTQGWLLYVGSDGKLYLAIRDITSNVYSLASASTLTANAWAHFAFCKSGTIYRLFINGVKAGEGSSSIQPYVNPGAYLNIGRWDNDVTTVRDFLGKLAYIRITKGIARYAANFVPPAEPFPNYNGQLIGTLDETLAASSFVAEAHQVSDGALSGRNVFTGASFTVDIKTPEKAHYLTVRPDTGEAWKASTVYALNGKVFPTNPITKPYYYTATVAGTSGTTEPNWPTTPGQTVTDGTMTWECVERLVQPITHGPLIPA